LPGNEAEGAEDKCQLDSGTDDFAHGCDQFFLDSSGEPSSACIVKSSP
jgi:hypothetical protein